MSVSASTFPKSPSVTAPNETHSALRARVRRLHHRLRWLALGDRVLLAFALLVLMPWALVGADGLWPFSPGVRTVLRGMLLVAALGLLVWTFWPRRVRAHAAERGAALFDQYLEPWVVHRGDPRVQMHRVPFELVMRNLIQNAVDCASTKVWIELCWNDDRITIRILDDGKGYSPQVLGWIGDPFIRRRKSQAERGQRQAYKGMGLGLFIAKTLLERTGATLHFANASSPYTGRPHPREKSGAIAQVEWKRGTHGLEATNTSAALGENIHFTHDTN